MAQTQARKIKAADVIVDTMSRLAYHSDSVTRENMLKRAEVLVEGAERAAGGIGTFPSSQTFAGYLLRNAIYEYGVYKERLRAEVGMEGLTVAILVDGMIHSLETIDLASRRQGILAEDMVIAIKAARATFLKLLSNGVGAETDKASVLASERRVVEDVRADLEQSATAAQRKEDATVYGVSSYY